MRFPFLLPDASVKTDVAPLIFLERLTALAAESSLYRCELENSSMIPGLTRLYLYPTSPTAHRGLRGEIGWRDQPELAMRVFVEVRAERWNTPSDDADYAAYAEGLRQLAQPLLELYNARYQSRRMLRIQKEEACFPKLSPRLQTYFQGFVALVNRQTPNSADMRRWYQFIRLAHTLHVELDESEVQFLLEREGFCPEDASHFVSVYSSGRILLQTPCPPVSAQTEALMNRIRQPLL